MENNKGRNSGQKMDRESEVCLTQIVEQDQVLAHRVSGVKFVLVVLSARGMVFDLEAIRQKVVLSYPDVAVFFQTTMGKPIGPTAPQQVDLLIDFTGPGQRQGWFYARKLRRMARVAVGRNAGLFRKKIYDRIFDENQDPSVPQEMLKKERFVQKKVLNLAGVSFVQTSETPPDRGKSIALELPAMRRL
jgi:hypothetical protein